MLEERYSTLTSKNQLTDQNMLTHNKKHNTDIKDINMEISSIKADISKMKETVIMISDSEKTHT